MVPCVLSVSVCVFGGVVAGICMLLLGMFIDGFLLGSFGLFL